MVERDVVSRAGRQRGSARDIEGAALSQGTVSRYTKSPRYRGDAKVKGIGVCKGDIAAGGDAYGREVVPSRVKRDIVGGTPGQCGNAGHYYIPAVGDRTASRDIEVPAYIRRAEVKRVGVRQIHVVGARHCHRTEVVGWIAESDVVAGSGGQGGHSNYSQRATLRQRAACCYVKGPEIVEPPRSRA